MASNKPLTPSVYWAQRKNLVYLRIAVEDCKNPTIKLDKQSLYFKGNGGSDNKEYEVLINLFAEIKPDDSKQSVQGRGIEFVLSKADETAPFWKRLISDDKKYHWIKIDFNKWKDEDDSDTEGPGAGGDFEDMMRRMGGLGGGMGGMGDMDMAGMGGMPGMNGLEEDDMDENDKDSDNDLPDLCD